MRNTLFFTLITLVSLPAFAAETPIGEPIEKNGMEIGAVYLQAVLMEPDMPHTPGPADIHLEADIRALKNNPNGFAVGEWIPSLQVSYHLSKTGSTWQQTGTLMPMVANDGPHYGENIKLNGPGKYHLTFAIKPPSYNGFARHIDKETGVGKWWDPFEVSWDFTYIGTGKKGGY
jgi:uncharacterized protein involved in high-affinity Fe2+ transport